MPQILHPSMVKFNSHLHSYIGFWNIAKVFCFHWLRHILYTVFLMWCEEWAGSFLYRSFKPPKINDSQFSFTINCEILLTLHMFQTVFEDWNMLLFTHFYRNILPQKINDNLFEKWLDFFQTCNEEAMECKMPSNSVYKKCQCHLIKYTNSKNK